VTAKITNNEPPIYPMTFSDKYFDMKAPPITAIPVAEACAAIAPEAIEKGLDAALRAIVVRKDRSPISAAKTKENVCSICALY
jgi:hypothetical protein